MTSMRDQYEQKKAAAEQAAAAQELAATQDPEPEPDDEVIDFTGADVPLPEIRPEPDAGDRHRTVRIKFPIEQMTFGREVLTEQAQVLDGMGQPVWLDDGSPRTTEVRVPGKIREFNFDEGRQYRLPRALAEHLIERGLAE